MIQTEHGLTAELYTKRAGDLEVDVAYDGRYLVRFTQDGEPYQEDLAKIKEVIRRFNDPMFLDEPGAWLGKSF